MQLNKLVGAIRAKVDWHAVEDVMVGDSQIARVRYWLNNDPERGGIGFVAEQWCFDDQMWLIIGDQYGTPDEAKAACEQHVTCLLLGMVEMDDALTQTHMRIGNITFHPNVMVQSVLDCAAREYDRRKDEKGDRSNIEWLLKRLGDPETKAVEVIEAQSGHLPRLEDQQMQKAVDNVTNTIETLTNKNSKLAAALVAMVEEYRAADEVLPAYFQALDALADVIQEKTKHLHGLNGQLDESTCQIMHKRLWMAAPEDAKCIAKDKDGRWYFWTNIPRFEEGDDCWHGGEYPPPVDWSAIGLPEPDRHWMDSLILRPEGM